MSRTHDAAFDVCPICGKKPYVETYELTVATAYCKGYGFHRHKKVFASIPYARPSKLLENLANKWNQIGYEESRFLFHRNGNPFKKSLKPVAPEKHAKWIHDINNLYGCSECMTRETMSHKKKKNFCPNCGAKMDGEPHDSGQ